MLCFLSNLHNPLTVYVFTPRKSQANIKPKPSRWWNPAAEWQSADRCHRIGQKRPCVITRLCIEDSVESRMVMLQEKKANMINGTINNDQVAMEKLTPEDMQFLFRGS